MPTPKKEVSKVWKYFNKFPEKDGRNCECNICKHRFMYTTSTANMWLHLRARHGISNEESIYFKTAERSESTAKQAVESMFKMNSTTKYAKTSAKYQDITHTLIEWIIQDYIPLQKIESLKFKTYCRKLDPRYEMPSRKHVQGVMHCLHDKAKERMKEIIQELQFVSLTTDTWTSKGNKGFIAVSAHGITKKWQLREHIIAVKHIEERHTGGFLSKTLTNIAENYSVENPITITDNGANIKAAIKLAEWPRFPCSAHMINLAVKAGLEAKDCVPTVKKILEKCRAIVGHFNHSSIATSKLNKAAALTGQTGMATSLVQEVPTRWNSCYGMLQRLVLLKAAVNSQLSDHDELILLPTEWRMIEWIITVLKPIKTISETLCGSKYPTMSMVYPSIRNLIDFVLNEEANPSPHTAIRDLKRKMRDKLKKDFSDGTNEEMMKICTILDPRFKYLVLSKPNQKQTLKLLKEMATFLADDNETEVSFKPATPRKRKCDEMEGKQDGPASDGCKWSEMFGPSYGSVGEIKPKAKDKLQLEIDSYIEEEILIISGNSLAWWKNKESQYPALCLVAKKFLGVPATSVPCERLFSQAGNTITSKRSRLAPGEAEMFVFLKAYYNLEDDTFQSDSDDEEETENEN